MISPTIIAEAWHSYREEVIPDDAPPVQLIESRRAFYAGAQAFMGVMKQINEDMPDEDGMRTLSSIDAELEDFKQRVLAGTA